MLARHSCPLLDCGTLMEPKYATSHSVISTVVPKTPSAKRNNTSLACVRNTIHPQSKRNYQDGQCDTRPDMELIAFTPQKILPHALLHDLGNANPYLSELISCLFEVMSSFWGNNGRKSKSFSFLCPPFFRAY